MSRLRYFLSRSLLLLIALVLVAITMLRLRQMAPSSNLNTQSMPSGSIDSPLPVGEATVVLTVLATPQLTLIPTETTWQTPSLFNSEGTPLTPTPDRSIVTTPTFEHPPTPLPLGKIVDLTNGTPVPPEKIVIFTVNRANGTTDEYEVPPWLLKNPTDEYLNRLMEIQPGDTLLGGWRTKGGSRQLPAFHQQALSTTTP